MQENFALVMILGISVLAQAAAASIAINQAATVDGRYQLAWGCIALALALMVERRLAPLWRLLSSGETVSFADSVFGMAISLLMAAGAYGVRRLFVDLNSLALTDVLTSLANRRSTIRHAQQEIKRAQRSGRPLAFLMFDIDHFKKVNDSHGHPFGDRVLQAIAGIARQAFRSVDTVGRIGGEEFLVVLPENNRVDALAAAERLRNLVACHDFSFEDIRPSITISIGVVVPEITDRTPDLDDVMKAVDDALYKAKNDGRNRVVFLD